VTLPKLSPHPRLYASREQLDRLRESVPASLRSAADHVAKAADEYARSPEFEWALNTHNAHLIRARIAQTRVVTLLVRWLQTSTVKYRRAVIDHVRAIGEWEYWSWITWRQNDADPLAIFDLSYGENSATLAIAYDWLGDSLSKDERDLFRRIALQRSIRPFLKHTASTKAGKHAWWFGKKDTNWNTVCAGGAGMLALAMHEELPEAAEVIRRAEWSFRPYMHALRASRGAWPEGIGYWNYGMRYAFMYLLSHERATGRRHPLLRQPATRATLWFPLDFCPNGVPCSFGDVNHWKPLPFHYAVAEHLRELGLSAALDRLRGSGDPQAHWPNAAELLVFHPRRTGMAPPPQMNVAKLYRGQDWAILADRLPSPRLYAAIRGGTTKVPHAHRDLLSFHCVVNDEAMIVNLPGGEYLDTTFSPRRWELFEMTPLARNTLLINGVGIANDSAVTTQAVTIGRDIKGFRLDATQAMGSMRDGSAAKFCGRVFLMLAGRALLIVDRFELPHTGRVESRMHTYAKAVIKGDRATLRGERERLAVSWACDAPAALHRGITTPTTPGRSATVLRWCVKELLETATMATLLVTGAVVPPLSVHKSGRTISVRIGGRGLPRVIRLNDRLRPVRGSKER
jgi:hypothetical protein